jgi:GntR family transcriptional regulator, vanillate catabolism transcriptional regulator
MTTIELHAMSASHIVGSVSNTQTERLVLTLREWILKGEFSAGQRLTELGLVSSLKASRTPIRIALERLANEGLLEPIPTGGFRVRSFSTADICDAIEIRGVLEGTAARFAAERLERVEELGRVKRLLPRAILENPISPEAFARFLDTNRTFHREVWCLAKSPSLFRELEHACKIPFAAPEALVFSPADYEPSTAHIAAEQHRAIIEAIENREGSRAEALAREHSRIARRNLEAAFRKKEGTSRLPGAALVTH